MKVLFGVGTESRFAPSTVEQQQLNMIEFIDLRVCAKLADLLSVSATARTLHVSESTVSRSLTRLEDHLGVALIDRTHRKLALTDAGVLFAEHARKIVHDMQDAELTVSTMAHSPSTLQ
jgi:DNA-binding transcriptional LysR family regulator